MIKVWFAIIPLLLPSFAPAQQGTPVTLSLAGDGAATSAGANFTLTFNGTATLGVFGPASLYVSGTASLSSIGATGTVTGDFAMLFTSGDALTGQITIPVGFLVPSLGQSSTATGSITVTGGAGNFAGA